MLPIEAQVCSFTRAVEFYKLGVKQVSSYYWTEDRNLISIGQIPFYLKLEKSERRVYAAFTIAEMGEMIPFRIDDSLFEIRKEKLYWIAAYRKPNMNSKILMRGESKTLANTLGKIISYLATYKLLNKSFLTAA